MPYDDRLAARQIADAVVAIHAVSSRLYEGLAQLNSPRDRWTYRRYWRERRRSGMALPHPGTDLGPRPALVSTQHWPAQPSLAADGAYTTVSHWETKKWMVDSIAPRARPTSRRPSMRSSSCPLRARMRHHLGDYPCVEKATRLQRGRESIDRSHRID